MSNARTSTPGWRLDPADPRAPSREVWAALSPEARAVVVDALPSELDPSLGVAPPEGDEHFDASVNPRHALRRWFGKLGRRAYVGTNLAVYYPAEKVFAPDLIVVLDVDPGPRMRWVVEAEGKGLDFVLEVHVAGDWRKDFVDNVERYAKLAIHEYFVFDVSRGALVGHRLDDTRCRYAPIAPGPDGFRSEVLQLDLLVNDARVRFFHAGARVPELDELVERLEGAMAEAMAHVAKLQAELKDTADALEAAKAAERAEREAREAEREAREAEREAKEAAEAELARVRRELDELRRR
ncbi:MAG: Uma2 family endonuclease [Deltaproteobacteria bacterium]|nr:Uma2 family endonuclease [Deltaproteobacteria bacterium]